MPPRKAAATKKAASRSRRTTAPKSNVFDFDAERAKLARKKKAAGQKYGLKMYGREWKLKRPNVVMTNELLDSNELSAMIDYLLAHVDESERDAFLEALRADEHLDEEMVVVLADQMTKVVYADLPTTPS